MKSEAQTVRNPYPSRLCLNCDTELKPLKSANEFSIGDDRYGKNRKYCSPDCATEYHKNEYRKDNPGRGVIPSATVGAISELVVAADLMGKGYSVFRALSAACDCDLAVLKEGKLIRVEVTTGSVSRIGGVSWPTKDESKFDVLAISIPAQNKITYKPDMPRITPSIHK